MSQSVLSKEQWEEPKVEYISEIARGNKPHNNNTCNNMRPSSSVFGILSIGDESSQCVIEFRVLLLFGLVQPLELCAILNKIFEFF